MSRSKSSRRVKSPNRPPEDQPWVWRTRSMLESEAWRAMTIGARRVVERIELEHMAHAGTMNGELKVTYNDFTEYGSSSRHMTSESIRIAQRLGFIDVVERGVRAFGDARRPSRYALTWLPRCDRTPATNRWQRITTRAAARAAVAEARADAKTSAPTWTIARAA